MTQDEKYEKWITEDVKFVDDGVQKLNTLLSDLTVLSVKTHNFHWNVIGEFFGPLHKLFDDIYNHLIVQIDIVAERIRQIGGIPFGSMAEYLDNTGVDEVVGKFMPASEMIQKLLYDIVNISRLCGIYINNMNQDQGTVNMLANMIQELDKDAWFLRSHITT